MTPEDRRYTNQHQWVLLLDDGLALVGITDFAQNQLGPIVYLELPEAGETLEEGEPYGVVESMKSSSDLFTPLDSEVIAVNSDAEDDPSMVNDDPYGAGWMLRVRLSEEGAHHRLMEASDYAESIGE
ncbi:MAG: glycine cleavage system protein GcvH [Acidimicrobiia bacterium]